MNKRTCLSCQRVIGTAQIRDNWYRLGPLMQVSKKYNIPREIREVIAAFTMHHAYHVVTVYAKSAYKPICRRCMVSAFIHYSRLTFRCTFPHTPSHLSCFISTSHWQTKRSPWKEQIENGVREFVIPHIYQLR